MDNMKFGSFIRELRQEKGITQKQLSEILGITGGAVSKWERGLSFPDITLLTSLADYFGVTVAELLEGERGIMSAEENIDETLDIAAVNAQINAARRVREKIAKLLTVISPAVFAVSLLVQCGYIFVLKPHGYEYISDFLFPLINATAVLSAGIFAAITIKSKRINTLIFSVCGVLMLLNILYSKPFILRRSVISVSPDLKYTVTVKINKNNGVATFYRNPKLFLFAKPKENLQSEVSGEIRTVWLENDICSLTWQDFSDNINTFVATYGTRGDTTSYDYVSTALLGDWTTESGKNIKLSTDTKGFTLTTDGKTEFFDYSDCRQYGTTAIVLKRGSTPKYTVALNHDCKIDAETGIIGAGGTVTLFPVDSEKSATYTLFCTTHKGADLTDYTILNIGKGEFAVKNGTLYISCDGKNTVEVPYPSDEIIIDDKLFVISESKTVFVKNENGNQSLVISDNRGKDWYEYKLEENYAAHALQFLDNNIGYMFEICDTAMGTAFGRISKTSDGGKNWNPVFFGIDTPNGPVFKTASEFIFTTENIGFLNMPSASGDTCRLYRTLDGGKTFSLFDIAGDAYDYYTLPEITQSGLEFKASGYTQIPSPEQKTYISHDNGKSWQEKE